MFLIECKSCQLVLGESEISSGQADIICLWCVEERDLFRELFSEEDGRTEDIHITIKEWGNRPYYRNQKRSIEQDNTMDFARMLKWKCDKEGGI